MKLKKNKRGASLYLFNIFSGIFLFIIFFFILTPVSLLMKVIGYDLLNTKFSNKLNSYWVIRIKILVSMKIQI